MTTSDIYSLSYNMMDVAAGVLKIKSPLFNPWLATLNDHDCDAVDEIKIFKKYKQKYKFDLEKVGFDCYTPIALMATYILANSEEDYA